LWPADIARGAREWVVGNVTAGTARDGHAAVGFAAPARLSGLAEIRLTSASGRLAGRDLTVQWLRPVPPVAHGTASLQLVDADTLRVDLGTGQQTAGPGRAGELSLEGGSVLITGLSHRDQFAEIRVNASGTVPNALALLSQPRLHLLSNHPVPLKEPRGLVAARVFVSLPLDARVDMDQVVIDASARLTRLHLADIIAGRDLDDGEFALSATGDALSLSGAGLIAAIPARIAGSVDFRPGPPAQVRQRFTVTGRAEAPALAAAGIDVRDVLTGPADLDAVYAQRRDGTADLDIRAGLRDAELRATPLGWRKPPGRPATARARLILDRASRLRRIDPIEADGVGLEVRGQGTLDAEGAIALTFDQLILGGTTARGTARISDGARQVAVNLAGPRLDLSGRFEPRPGGTPTSGQAGASGLAGRAAAGRGTDWRIDARFGQVALARGQLATAFSLRAEVAAGMAQAMRLSALTGPGRPVTASITPDRSGRLVAVTAADGGALLRDLGAMEGVDEGRLVVSGRYLDQRADHPLSGVITLDDFKVRGAPVLAKVMQAVTLYGLVQAVEGPGMRFNHLAAPFLYAGGVLTLDDARAFNASLGLTAKGRIDFNSEHLALEGTIVPAYMLNTVLGRIPLIGRLFSPERGGGVIAARYVANGPLGDPAVRVNPLSALTPGFLRGIFGR
ncbi:MAG TPA: AsmA-like C-terminal region-containing protein, partial [Acetobacteraceae bacterium]|nr:AsmA-like C-terminal region-containing protein [Acetobacteraceae bacterium]